MMEVREQETNHKQETNADRRGSDSTRGLRALANSGRFPGSSQGNSQACRRCWPAVVYVPFWLVLVITLPDPRHLIVIKIKTFSMF